MKVRPGRLTLVLSAALSAATLSSCGTAGPTDRGQIAAIVRREGRSPSTLCSHLTGRLLASLGGQNGCLRQASSAAPDPTTHASSIKVSGHAARAVVIDRTGTRTIGLVKDRGEWKVASVG